MRQASETFHRLEMRFTSLGSWLPPTEDYYRPAQLLAYQGRLVEAIESAEKIRIEKHGNMRSVQFRCVTTTRTVTVASGPFELCIEEFPRG